MNVSDIPGAIRKPWGWTVDLLAEPTLQLSLLDIEAGGECSRHFHREKRNKFLVRSGRLIVRWWRPLCPFSMGMIRLEPGETIEIPAGRVHQFKASGPCRVLEIYTPAHENAAVRTDDIVRPTRAA